MYHRWDLLWQVRRACQHMSWIPWFFPRMSGSWLLPDFLKAKRPWEMAERKKGRDSSCGLQGFDHSSNLFTRWNNLLQEIAERLRASKGLLQLWQRYKDCYQQCSSTVRQREDQANELLKTATGKDFADDEVTTWIQDCNVCSVKLCSFSQLRGLKITRGSPLLNSILGLLETCVQTHFFLVTHLRHRRDSFISATQISWVSHTVPVIPPLLVVALFQKLVSEVISLEKVDNLYNLIHS